MTITATHKRTLDRPARRPAFSVQRTYERLCALPVPRWVDMVADHKRGLGLAVTWLAGVATAPAIMVATGFPHPAKAGPVPPPAAYAPAVYRPSSGALVAAMYQPASLFKAEVVSASRLSEVQAQQAARAAVAAKAAKAHAAAVAAAQAKATAPAVSTPVVSVAGVGGAFGACVRQRENGGSYAWGTGDGGGAYQFEPGTWAVYAPPGAVWGSAGPAAQDQAFLNALARGDAAAWNADGCPQQFGLAAFSKAGVPWHAAGVVLVASVTPATTSYAGLAAVPAAAALRGLRVSVPTPAQVRTDLAELAAQAKAAAAAKARAAAQVHAQAVAVAAAGSLRIRALDWALAQAGKPYVWGATGPYGFDCSGLVYAAYQAMGVAIPRDTYEMLGAVGSKLIPVSSPQPGDLAFYGTGHVELYIKPGVTFGAQMPGTPVGYHNYGGSWSPTAFYTIAG